MLCAMQAVRSWTRGNSGLGETAGTAGEDSTSPALEVVNVTTFERARRQAAGNYADRLFEGRLIAYIELAATPNYFFAGLLCWLSVGASLLVFLRAKRTGWRPALLRFRR